MSWWTICDRCGYPRRRLAWCACCARDHDRAFDREFDDLRRADLDRDVLADVRGLSSQLVVLDELHEYPPLGAYLAESARRIARAEADMWWRRLLGAGAPSAPALRRLLGAGVPSAAAPTTSRCAGVVSFETLSGPSLRSWDIDSSGLSEVAVRTQLHHARCVLQAGHDGRPHTVEHPDQPGVMLCWTLDRS